MDAFKRLKRWIAPVVSSDEAKVFALIAQRLPRPAASCLLEQLKCIEDSEDASDGTAIRYRVKAARGIDVCRITQEAGVLLLAEIHVVLYDQAQPFLCHIENGVVRSLTLMSPYPLSGTHAEFDVLLYSDMFVVKQ